jgi:nucleoside-diphosphate-sugar epimerase
MRKAVLVTGASGFIGSHLVSWCLRDGYRVKALLRRGNARISSLRSSGVEVVEDDVRACCGDLYCPLIFVVHSAWL